MPKAASATRSTKGVRQLTALTSPARQEIFDTLAASGASSAVELGAMLGRAPDSLYFHLKRLEDVGLVVRTERAIERGRTEAVFEAAPVDLRQAYDFDNPRHRDLLARTFSAMLRITTRDLAHALEAGLACIKGRRRNFRAGRVKAWLTPAELQTIHEHLDAITDIVQRAGRPAGGELHAVTFALTPVAPSERAPEGDATE